MKAGTFFNRSLLVIAVLSLLISSCKKENDHGPDDNDIATAGDHSFAESSFNDIGNIADEASLTGSVSSYRYADNARLLATCATVSKDTLNDTIKVTIDFGSVNCMGNDGRSRRGKVIVRYTGHYLDSAASKIITTDNYFVNDNQILGSRTIVNKGHNTSGNLNWSIDENGSIVLANNAGVITWKSIRNRELTEGESTPFIIADNVYSITGSANGINAKGLSFSATITNPLIRKMALGCRKHFVKGTIVLQPDGKPERSLDFGNGDCDNLATVSVNGHTKQITLR